MSLCNRPGLNYTLIASSNKDCAYITHPPNLSFLVQILACVYYAQVRNTVPVFTLHWEGFNTISMSSREFQTK